MKKILIVVMTVFLAISLVGCGDKGKENSGEDTSKSQAQKTEKDLPLVDDLSKATVKELEGLKKEAKSVNKKYKGVLADFKTVDINGNVVDDSMIKENDFTLIMAWTTNCPACKAIMPTLSGMKGKLKKSNIGVASIVLDASSESKAAIEVAKKVVEKRKFEVPTMVNFKKFEDAAVKDIYFVPSVFMVDKEGNIITKLDKGLLNVEDYEKIAYALTHRFR